MPLLQHQGDVAQEYPGEAPMDFPISIKCRNSSCPRIYRFEGIALEEIKENA